MFLAVSFNPAIDKRLTLRKFEHGSVNRALTAKAAPGGKAAHVAMVLQVLGASVDWLGLHGGPEGTLLVDGLMDLGIRSHGVPISGHTRTNLEILEASGTVTELLEPGPVVSQTDIMSLRCTCEDLLRGAPHAGALILSGSLPPGTPADSYARFVELGHKHGWKVFVDSSGEPLRRALDARPDFVKANQSESSEATAIPIHDLRDVGFALEKLLNAGAQSAAITLGARGLAWQSDAASPASFAAPPSVKVFSAVGSGDAALAGFAFASSVGLDKVATLQLAVACGAANCLAELPGQPRKSDIERMRQGVTVVSLESAIKGRSLQSC